MRILAIVHDADAGPGVFAEALGARGDRLDCWPISTGAPAPGDPRNYDAVLSLGGGANPDQVQTHPWLVRERALLRELLGLGTPLLGVCLGAELLGEAAGGRTRAVERPEVGWYPVRVTGAGARDPLLGPLAPSFEALGWHSYEVELPPGAVALASSATSLQAFRAGERAWAIQFHAEVTHGALSAWIEQERRPEEVERLGLDRDDLRARTKARIEAWNDLGRSLCGRFLEAAGNGATA